VKGVDGNLFHSILILGTNSCPWADESRDALPGTVESLRLSDRNLRDILGPVPGVNEAQGNKSYK